MKSFILILNYDFEPKFNDPKWNAHLLQAESYNHFFGNILWGSWGDKHMGKVE